MQQAELIDSTEKLKELENAANDGFARAQFNLAVCYEQGKWVEQDMEKAVEWYKNNYYEVEGDTWENEFSEESIKTMYYENSNTSKS